MEITPVINYEIIASALEFYQEQGFKYIDVPWAVDQKYLDATRPPQAEVYTIPDGCLVGSGEQGYIAMDGENILPPGRYVCATPCWRDDIRGDGLHFGRFFKVELIDCIPRTDTWDSVLEPALEFLGSYLPVQLDYTKDGVDIVTQDGVELGSYGFRKFGKFQWWYGTGVAEPRLSTQIKLGGYHNRIIRKAKAGTADKVIEEAKEYKDAMDSDNPIMGLVELSDVYGAIECILEQDHPHVSMSDLRSMSNVTRRVFKSGHRS